MPFSLSIAAIAAACSHAPPREPDHGAAPPEATAPQAAELTSHDIDEALRAAWKDAGIEPAPRVDDARFLRRAWLDLAGTIPPPDVVKAFLDNPSPDKRRAAVAALLASPRWGERWANVWERLLLGPETRIPFVDRAAFHAWVRDAFAKNEPYDRFVRDLVTATGRNLPDDEDHAPVNGAVSWLLRFRDTPEDLAGTTSRVFLGVQIQCAQCHDHKTEKWTQSDFRKFTACFMRTQARAVDRDRNKYELEVRDVQKPAYLQEGKKKLDQAPFAKASPGALDGTDFSQSPNRREALATWLTDPKNPWFARAFVNRVWDQLLGRGFVDPVDDLRPSNPPAMPELFDRLAADFASHGFDVRRLVALICDTEVYQLAAQKPARGEGQLWSRFPLKALGPDELLDSIVAATGTEQVLSRISGDDLDGLRTDLRRQMSFLFDIDEQADDNVYQGTIPQALMLLNGRLVNGGATAIKGDALSRLFEIGGTDAAMIESLYLRTLSRRPTPEETAYWERFVNAPRESARDEGPAGPPLKGRAGASFVGERRLARVERLFPKLETPKQQAFEDVLAALLNASEFSFNH